MGAEGGIAKLCRAAIEDCCRQPAPVDVAERSQQAAFAQLVVLVLFLRSLLALLVQVSFIKNKGDFVAKV